MSFTCDICNKAFSRKDVLVRHKKTVHGRRDFTCKSCGKSFNRGDILKRHEKIHQEKKHKCQHCSKAFHRHDACLDHMKVCNSNKPNGEQNNKRQHDDKSKDEPQPKKTKHDEQSCDIQNPCDSASSFRGALKTFKYKPRVNEKYDLNLCLKGKQKTVEKQLIKQLELKRGIKWSVRVQVQFVKPKPDGTDMISEPHFRSACMTTVNPHDIDVQLMEAYQKILSAFAMYQREGSGWLLSHVLHLDLYIAEYTPIKGSSYLPLPAKIQNKKAVLNIQNNDNKCFQWSVLAALHPVNRKYQPHRIHHYRPYESELNLDGIDFPVPISQIAKFEKQNKLNVNVFGFEKDDLFPVHISKERFTNHVNLLLYSQGEKGTTA